MALFDFSAAFSRRRSELDGNTHLGIVITNSITASTSFIHGIAGDSVFASRIEQSLDLFYRMRGLGSILFYRAIFFSELRGDW